MYVYIRLFSGVLCKAWVFLKSFHITEIQYTSTQLYCFDSKTLCPSYIKSFHASLIFFFICCNADKSAEIINSYCLTNDYNFIVCP